MEPIIINLPFPPTVNGYYKHSKWGVHISKSGKLFRERVAEECAEQSCSGLMLDTTILVDVILYPPDRRTRDLDNYMKGLLDALTQAKVWADDSLIDTLRNYRGAVTSGGFTKVRISAHHGFTLPNTSRIWEVIEI